jgi:hypothetical protein
MKRLFRIFELTRNEQRVVLIVMFILIAIAFIRYERRVHLFSFQTASGTEAKPSSTPSEIEGER